MKIVGIYKIESPVGSVYIGQSHDIIDRIRGFKYKPRLKQHVNLNLSVLKYGWDSHKVEVIHELPKDVSQQVLDTYEILYMQAYKDCGIALLNIREGGRNGELGAETILKLKGKATMLGKHHSKRTIKKMRLVKIGKYAKKVICSKTGIVYNSIKEAAIAIGLKPAILGKQLSGENSNKTTLKYHI